MGGGGTNAPPVGASGGSARRNPHLEKKVPKKSCPCRSLSADLCQPPSGGAQDSTHEEKQSPAPKADTGCHSDASTVCLIKKTPQTGWRSPQLAWLRLPAPHRSSGYFENPAEVQRWRRVAIQHVRIKRFCADCGGSARCPHGRQKNQCKVSLGDDTAPEQEPPARKSTSKYATFGGSEGDCGLVAEAAYRSGSTGRAVKQDFFKKRSWKTRKSPEKVDGEPVTK